jgi:hypothetical protein
MNWPEIVTLQVARKSTNEGLEGVILYITAIASRKNSYSLGPFKTDRNGRVSISKNDFEGAIREYQEASPMDYVDGLDQCQRIAVVIEDQGLLESRLERIRTFYPRDAEKLKNMIATCANGKIKSTRKEWNVPPFLDLLEIQLDEDQEGKLLVRKPLLLDQ